MNKQIEISRDPAVVRQRAEDFTASYGLPLIAGGENPGGGPAVATPPPAAPAAPAVPAAAPAAAPPPAAPAAPGNAGAPAAPDLGQLMQQQQDILGRLDELAPPAQVDPIAVELGLIEPPAQAPQGPQFVDPNQPQAPTAGGPQQPVAPTQQPGLGLGNPNDPAQVAQLQAVESFIESRAQQVAEKMIGERVSPYLQQQESTRRRGEVAELKRDYPKLNDNAYSASVVAQARAWARETLGNEAAASEPGFIELTHLAMESLATSQAAAAAAAAGQPGGAEVPIEGGGAAAPQPAVTDSQKKAQEIVDAKPGGGLNSIWV